MYALIISPNERVDPPIPLALHISHILCDNVITLNDFAEYLIQHRVLLLLARKTHIGTDLGYCLRFNLKGTLFLVATILLVLLGKGDTGL